MPPGGIRTHNLSRRAAADLLLRPRGHRGRPSINSTRNKFTVDWLTFTPHDEKQNVNYWYAKMNSHWTFCVFVLGAGMLRYSDTAPSFTFVFPSMPRRFCDQQLLTHSWHTGQNGKRDMRQHCKTIQMTQNHFNLLRKSPSDKSCCFHNLSKRGNLCILYRYRYCHTYSRYFLTRPASWSSGQSLWLLIMRSRVRFPALPWEFSLKGKIPAVTTVWVD